MITVHVVDSKGEPLTANCWLGTLFSDTLDLKRADADTGMAELDEKHYPHDMLLRVRLAYKVGVYKPQEFLVSADYPRGEVVEVVLEEDWSNS